MIFSLITTYGISNFIIERDIEKYNYQKELIRNLINNTGYDKNYDNTVVIATKPFFQMTIFDDFIPTFRLRSIKTIPKKGVVNKTLLLIYETKPSKPENDIIQNIIKNAEILSEQNVDNIQFISLYY